MKKTLIALAILASTGMAFACGPGGCTPAVPVVGSVSMVGSAVGSNVVTSGSTASASSSGTGASQSGSWNKTTATSLVALTGTKTATVAPNCDALLAGSVTFNGAVSTSSESLAYNQSTPGGTGTASAGGTALANVSGTAHYAGSNPQGTVSGSVAGQATSNTANSVFAGPNQGGYAFGANVAGVTATAGSSLATQSPLTAGTCGGHTCGPATSDQKTAGTSVVAYSVNSPLTGITNGIYGLNNAVVFNNSVGSASGTATSGATGGVSAPLVSVVTP
jgi:hypothetical protein